MLRQSWLNNKAVNFKLQRKFDFSQTLRWNCTHCALLTAYYAEVIWAARESYRPIWPLVSIPLNHWVLGDDGVGLIVCFLWVNYEPAGGNGKEEQSARNYISPSSASDSAQLLLFNSLFTSSFSLLARPGALYAMVRYSTYPQHVI